MAVRFLITDTSIPRIQPMICGRRQCPPGWYAARPDTAYFLLHYVISGKGTFHKNGKVYTVGTGDLFICGPGENGEYGASEDDPYDYAWVRLDCSKELHGYLCRDVIHLPAASRIFAQIAAAYGTPGQTLQVCGLIYQLFALLSSESKPATSNRDYIRQAISYIHMHYTGPIQVSGIAEHLGLERSYFCRLFRKQTGMSPQEYIVSYRLEKAEDMLRDTKLSQKEICKLVGYNDVCTFSRMFKHKYGIAPGKCRTVQKSVPNAAHE